MWGAYLYGNGGFGADVFVLRAVSLRDGEGGFDPGGWGHEGGVNRAERLASRLDVRRRRVVTGVDRLLTTADTTPSDKIIHKHYITIILHHYNFIIPDLFYMN